MREQNFLEAELGKRKGGEERRLSRRQRLLLRDQLNYHRSKEDRYGEVKEQEKRDILAGKNQEIRRLLIGEVQVASPTVPLEEFRSGFLEHSGLCFNNLFQKLQHNALYFRNIFKSEFQKTILLFLFRYGRKKPFHRVQVLRASQIQPPGLKVQGVPQDYAELTAVRHGLVLVEYSQAHPFFLGVPGMRSRLLNFVQIEDVVRAIL